MREIKIINKQKYLNENYPFEGTPKLSDQKQCIHCNISFNVGEFKVFIDQRGDEFICCPNAPECDGTVIDWFNVE
jgi:hypothetical protein